MRCVSVIGPSQSGKSTLVERLAGLEDQPARAEIGHGLALTRFRTHGEGWTLIDCPGSVESLADVHAALLASDSAVLCVGPDPEEAVLAAPFLRAAEATATPTLLFVNRMDEAEARMRDVVAALQDYSVHAIVLRQIPIRGDGGVTGAVDLVSERAWQYREGQPSALIEIPEDLGAREHEARTDLLEQLADVNEWLLEELVEEREPAAGPLYAICRDTLAENALVPAFLGSASHGNGILRLMKALRHEVPEVGALKSRLESAGGNGEAVRAVGFHAIHRRHLGKVVWLRALDAPLEAGSRLAGGRLGSFVEAGAPEPDALEPGEVGAAVKSDHLGVPRLYTETQAVEPPAAAAAPPPMVATVLSPANERDEAKLSTAIARLAEDDPGLLAAKEPVTGRVVALTQGPVHERRLLAALREVFGIEVAESAPRTEFAETITRPASRHYRHRKQTGGAGQFADVKISVAPTPRGAGFVFEETVKGGAVPRNYIPAVEAGARDAMAEGPLGFPVVDVQVTLTDGQHHAVDSSDFAFRTAGRLAVQEALAEATPVLLQPIHRVVFHVPSIFSGALVPVVSSLRGQVLGFDRDPEGRGWDAFRALLPGSCLAELAHGLRAATQGTGHFDHAFDHFEEVYGKEAERIAAAQA